MNNNFKVLLKYSLKPKIANKKAILGLFGLFAFAFILVAIGGFLFATFIEQDGLENQFTIADEIVIAPDTEMSKALSLAVPGSKVIADEEAYKPTAKDEETSILINTETGVIKSNVAIDFTSQLQLEAIVAEVNKQVFLSSLSPDVKAQYNSNLDQLSYQVTNREENDNNTVLGGLVIANTIIIYMLILFGFQLLGNEIFEEKSSRAMEIIITNTNPQTHMLSKILSTVIFLLAIILAFLLGAVLGIVALGVTMPDSVGVIVETLETMLSSLNISLNSELIIFISLNIISVVASVLLFQIFGATMAAMASTYEDYQKASGPVAILLLVPYFISFMSIAALSKILMYIPFFTSFFAPPLYLKGDISLFNFGLCTLIQVVLALVLYKLLAPVYREGLLNYNSSSIREMVKRGYQK